MNDEQEIVRLKDIEEKYIELQEKHGAALQEKHGAMIKRDEDDETLLSMLFDSKLFIAISQRMLDDCQDLIHEEIYKFKKYGIEELLPEIQEIVNSEVDNQLEDRIKDVIDNLEFETRVI
jgi:hypothetical protein